MDDRKDVRRRMKLRKIGCYNVAKAIGRGNFATVYLAYHQHAKSKVAIKAVDSSLIEPENMVKIEREITIMKTLEHPHVVKLYEVMRSERYLYMVTEYCKGGELFDLLVERGRIGEEDAKKWFHQAASAVLYLHDNGIVHRDLKAENILLDKNGDVKLIDFGFSNTWSAGDDLLNTWCGSPPYAAPELLLGNDYDGYKADVWSLGVLLYILVTGGFPFPGESIDKLKRAVLSGQLRIPFWVSVECSDLLRKMLVVNPDNRVPLAKVISHRFLHGVGASTKQPLKKQSSLMPSSSSSSPSADKKIVLVPAVAAVMQRQANWNEETILKEVTAKNYDSAIFPTYEIMVDKLKRKKRRETSLSNEFLEHPRRGSRGSILSGKVNVDPEPIVTAIPTQDLAHLHISTSEDNDSDDSSSDADGLSSSSSFRHKRRKQLRNAVTYDEQRHSNRRYSEQLLPPLLAQVPQFNAAIHQAAMQQVQLAALAAQQTQMFSPLPGFVQSPVSPNQQVPLMDFARMLPVPNYERRASASECFPIGQILSGILKTQQGQALPASPGGGSSANPATPTIEEEGRRYLAQHGGSKRNTVHSMGGSPLAMGSPIARHSKTPYQKNPAAGAERRSSWASPTISQQQAANLERMYRASLKGSGSAINDIVKLQREFQELGRLTLGIPSSNSAFTPTGMHSPAELAAMAQLQSACTPTINITDENNRSLGPPPGCSSSSAGFDTQPYEASALDALYCQRPATVIGFSPTSPVNGFGCSSNASTPERPIPNIPIPEATNKFFTLCIPQAELVNRVRDLLDEQEMPYNESAIQLNPQKEFIKLTLPNFGVEIGVAEAIPDNTKSFIEFSCNGEDLAAYDVICAALLENLKPFEMRPFSFHTPLLNS